MPNPSLLSQVKVWLDQERGNWRTIAVEADVGYHWLTAMMQGDIRDPGVQKIERLVRCMHERETAL